ncbi:DUF4406 domain-containing protein [Paenibacillus alvei]|uniref:DUF4406 domain-containing protein n=1 Tax=Paenibacillus alvei TaxID=44250 RepID=UPI001EE67058|nr:DUF4406 domain-containing protein [Paenibacillus alvei]
MNGKPVIYLSGPMTGLPEYNHPAFHLAALRLRRAGYRVLNPADVVVEKEDWGSYMRADIKLLMDADMVAVLPGWEQSRGARIEVDLAEALEMKMITIDKLIVGGETA